VFSGRTLIAVPSSWYFFITGDSVADLRRAGKVIHKVTNLRREASMIFLQQSIQSYLTTLTTEGKSPTYTEWLGRRLRAEKRLAEGNSIGHK
jgi:hypothetical protein